MSLFLSLALRAVGSPGNATGVLVPATDTAAAHELSRSRYEIPDERNEIA